MTNRFRSVLSGFFLIAFPVLAVAMAQQPGLTAEQPRPAAQATAVVAGGCFWGVDAVFKHVKGVTDVVSGYAGGDAPADYEQVSTGTTGHAESVEITYDPSKVSYRDLLKVFFMVAHDPTELNRQGPDSGTQYRSAIFYSNEQQKKAAQAYIAQLDHSKAFSDPVVTQVFPLKTFYPAEEYHQNFLARHPDYPYIVENDLPKLDNLREKFQDLYRQSPAGSQVGQTAAPAAQKSGG
jgi:peptide-methionine (S)-S-oxide reductase